MLVSQYTKDVLLLSKLMFEDVSKLSFEQFELLLSKRTYVIYQVVNGITFRDLIGLDLQVEFP